MSAKHTPGPWVIHPGRAIEDKEKGLPALYAHYIEPEGVSGVYRGPICSQQSCEHIDGITKEELLANARLIAAAPELLEALIAVVKIADRDTDVFMNAKAAISKATGKAVE